MNPIAYSFDVFDTALTRIWAKPTDLFWELGIQLQTAQLIQMTPETWQRLTDSDILFFPGVSDLVELARSDNTSSLYLPDCAAKMDERVIYDDFEKLNPVNGGFIVFKESLDWSFAVERLSKITELNHYFTEQTLVHLTMHYNQAKPLCSKRYVLSVEDQFIYPDKYAGKEIALRHYVNDVRHKFWFNALS